MKSGGRADLKNCAGPWPDPPRPSRFNAEDDVNDALDLVEASG